MTDCITIRGVDPFVLGDCAPGWMYMSDISYRPMSDIWAISAAMLDGDDELSEVTSTA